MIEAVADAIQVEFEQPKASGIKAKKQWRYYRVYCLKRSTETVKNNAADWSKYPYSD